MILILAALVLSAGCAKKPNTDVLVKVGSREITVQDFEREVQWHVQNRRPLPEPQALLERMIGRELRLQKARASGLENDPDVRRRYEALLAGKVDELELQPRLETLAVTPDEIRADYQKEIARYSRPGKAHLALVCVKRDRHMTAEQSAEADARIRSARQAALALPAGTRGFGAVAANYSEDQASRYRGGDVGWFDQGRSEYRWPAEVIAAGFALATNGAFSDVIQTTDGFYLVSRTDWREPSVMPLEQLRPSIQRRLLAEKREQTEKAFDQQLHGFAPVQLFTQTLAKLQYPTTTLAKAEQTVPPMLHGTTLSSHEKTPAN